MFDESTKIKIINRLSERISSFECPICHNKTFNIVDGYFIQRLQKQVNEYVIGAGPFMPSIAIVCTNCGFMSQHNIGVLGLLTD